MQISRKSLKHRGWYSIQALFSAVCVQQVIMSHCCSSPPPHWLFKRTEGETLITCIPPPGKVNTEVLWKDTSNSCWSDNIYSNFYLQKIRLKSWALLNYVHLTFTLILMTNSSIFTDQSCGLFSTCSDSPAGILTDYNWLIFLPVNVAMAGSNTADDKWVSELSGRWIVVWINGKMQQGHSCRR